jgi:5-methylcytosine-specific restriction endonuclease McrA
MTSIAPLPFKPLKNHEWKNRVLFFDPGTVFTQLTLNPYLRRQEVSIKNIFPKRGGVCSCGCNRQLPGKKTRWATRDCQLFAIDVWAIIAGRTETITKHLRKYHRWRCSKCGCKDKLHEFKSGKAVTWLKIDHIVPVKYGGGACWLNNYQILCHDCHVSKTKSDFILYKQPPVLSDR